MLQDITNGMEKSIFHKSNNSAYRFRSEWKQPKVVHAMVNEEFSHFEHISAVIIFIIKEVIVSIVLYSMICIFQKEVHNIVNQSFSEMYF
jgi:hypothetical protein